MNSADGDSTVESADSGARAVSSLRITRPAKRVGGWAQLGIDRRQTARSTAEAIDEQRAERV